MLPLTAQTRNEPSPAEHPTTLEDVRRRFPNWEIAIDRDFTGRCFGYRRSGSATLSGQDPADLQKQIADWLRRHDDLS
jgi:hypothetical protein